MLETRQVRAAELKLETARVASMSDQQLTVIRADIKVREIQSGSFTHACMRMNRPDKQTTSLDTSSKPRKRKKESGFKFWESNTIWILTKSYINKCRFDTTI